MKVDIKLMHLQCCLISTHPIEYRVVYSLECIYNVLNWKWGGSFAHRGCIASYIFIKPPASKEFFWKTSVAP